MNKYKIIAICGKAGAGKDRLLQRISSRYDVRTIVSCTTRPKREGEIDGVNYYYLTREEFAQKVINDDILEAVEFNGWFYGTIKDGLSADKWNVGVFNPEGIEMLLENPSVELKVFYLYVDDKERLIRQLKRETHPNVAEIIRRYSADEKDFKFLKNRFTFVKMKNFTLIDLNINADTIAKMCGLVGQK